MQVVSSVKLKIKAVNIAAMNSVVIRKPSVPACAQPRLHPKYSPEITRPTAMAHSCHVLSVRFSSGRCTGPWPPCSLTLVPGGQLLTYAGKRKWRAGCPDSSGHLIDLRRGTHSSCVYKINLRILSSWHQMSAAITCNVDTIRTRRHFSHLLNSVLPRQLTTGNQTAVGCRLE